MSSKTIDLKTIEAALDEYVRPLLATHGGDMEVTHVEDGVVYFRMKGACAGCSAADLTSEDLALKNAEGYSEFFFDRIGGASGRNLYSACAALCWTDSAQHGRQSFSENGRMSGRVDAIRVKKQSYDVFSVLHSVAPRVKLMGHWNYPRPDGKNYRAFKKAFNGSYWEETSQTEERDPHCKTVYCIGSYAVKEVALLINGMPCGRCDKPRDGFVFAFPGIDITQSGVIEAVGYGYDGQIACRDRIETADAPAAIRMEAHTAPGGWRADGFDLCFVDIHVTDGSGRVCPLADMRIDFAVTGPAVFLGGYNSGRFNGNGRQDSVVAKPFVYAECGTNRVLLRAGLSAGAVRLTASAPGLAGAEIVLQTSECGKAPLSDQAPAVLYAAPGALPPASSTSPVSSSVRTQVSPAFRKGNVSVSLSSSHASWRKASSTPSLVSGSK